jgi:hypothetical protein
VARKRKSRIRRPRLLVPLIRSRELITGALALLWGRGESAREALTAGSPLAGLAAPNGFSPLGAPRRPPQRPRVARQPAGQRTIRRRRPTEPATTETRPTWRLSAVRKSHAIGQRAAFVNHYFGGPGPAAPGRHTVGHTQGPAGAAAAISLPAPALGPRRPGPDRPAVHRRRAPACSRCARVAISRRSPGPPRMSRGPRPVQVVQMVQANRNATGVSSRGESGRPGHPAVTRNVTPVGFLRLFWKVPIQLTL